MTKALQIKDFEYLTQMRFIKTPIRFAARLFDILEYVCSWLKMHLFLQYM